MDHLSPVGFTVFCYALLRLVCALCVACGVCGCVFVLPTPAVDRCSQKDHLSPVGSYLGLPGWRREILECRLSGATWGYLQGYLGLPGWRSEILDFRLCVNEHLLAEWKIGVESLFASFFPRKGHLAHEKKQ